MYSMQHCTLLGRTPRHVDVAEIETTLDSTIRLSDLTSMQKTRCDARTTSTMGQCRPQLCPCCALLCLYVVMMLMLMPPLLMKIVFMGTALIRASRAFPPFAVVLTA